MAKFYPRCTNYSAAKLGVFVTKPLTYGTSLLEALDNAGWSFDPMKIERGGTVKQFVKTHPKGVWQLSTAGHAMLLINGTLHDYAGRGPDGRRVRDAIPLERRKCRR